MNKPHKHAECIKAWADGACIQYRVKFNDIGQEAWYDTGNPNWNNANNDYRIKPAEKVVRWQWIMKGALGFYVTAHFHTEKEVVNRSGKEDIVGKAEWTRMEFDE